MTRVILVLTLLLFHLASAKRIGPVKVESVVYDGIRYVVSNTQSDSQSALSAGPISEVPDSVRKALTNGPVGKKYDLSFQIKPSYLEGDFDGDGKTDTAVLVKERATGKVGIAIVNGTTGKVAVLGAGIAIGNGGDDFEWMDSWHVFSKTRTAPSSGETSVPRLRGDALLVEKSEAASALIYWNGKKYVWSQRGD